MPVSLTVIRLSQRRGSISVLIKVYMTLLRLATHLSVTPRIDLAHTNGIETSLRLATHLAVTPLLAHARVI